MKRTVLLGYRRFMIPLPSWFFRRQIRQNAKGASGALAFMSEEHHRVRDFCVRELHRVGKPLSPSFIAERLGLAVDRVNALLDELEKRMIFVYRNGGSDVVWAYPVTLDSTPHRITYSSGEEGFAAWGVDAIATPFVQGHLQQKPLSVTINTECAHCHQPMHIELNIDLSYHVEGKADPIVYMPFVDFGKLRDPSIIDAFWRKSIFFWSEEHARAYRWQFGGNSGLYLNLEQMAFMTRLIQGAIFAFAER